MLKRHRKTVGVGVKANEFAALNLYGVDAAEAFGEAVHAVEVSHYIHLVGNGDVKAQKALSGKIAKILQLPLFRLYRDVKAAFLKQTVQKGGYAVGNGIAYNGVRAALFMF